MKKWRCQVCGYVYDGDEPPDTCPKCQAPKEKFSPIPEEEAEKIEQARLTNSLHMQLHGLMEQALAIAEKGLEEKMDRSCVKLFTQTKDFSSTMIRKIEAELTKHVAEKR